MDGVVSLATFQHGAAEEMFKFERLCRSSVKLFAKEGVRCRQSFRLRRRRK